MPVDAACLEEPAMIVKVEVMPWLSELVTGSISHKVVLMEEMPAGTSLRKALELVGERHPRLGKMVFDARRGQMSGHAELAINGAMFETATGMDYPLQDGDTISILPGIAGGSRASDEA